MEGKSEDYGDCACKNCAGDWVHRVEALPSRIGFAPVASDAQLAKKELGVSQMPSLPGKKDVSASAPKVVIQQKPNQIMSAVPSTSTKTPPSNAPTAMAKQPSLSTTTSTPLPRPRSKEQEIDSSYRRYIYRIGELVWFNRGSAWGLAVVIKRDVVTLMEQPGKGSGTRFLVQPLSHPLSHPDSKLMTTDDALRPWLAWSAPAPTHRALTGKTYSMIDWKAVLEGRFGQGDAEVDGSILAAKQIDESFSLLSPLANNTLTTGERTYLAMFLGGEKIYTGEAVRLRINQGQDIMVIHGIVEKLKPNSTNVALATVHVVGDVYRLVTGTFESSSLKHVSNPHLPPRMRADLDFRNNVTSPTKQIHSYWKLLQNSVRLSIADIKGRWYESSVLLPVLRGNNDFAADIRRGDISDVGDWINGRGDANGAAGKVGVRYRERLEAIGRAIPTGLKLGGNDDSGEGGIDQPSSTANAHRSMLSSSQHDDIMAHKEATSGHSSDNLGSTQPADTERAQSNNRQYLDLDQMEV